MKAFLDSLDIANTAMDYVGSRHIRSVTEDTKQNNLVAECFDKLRQAELRRNTWTFSTRRVILRPLDENTMILAPQIWSASVTYLRGSIVADADGGLWISLVAKNLNNEPGSTTAWEAYFGPMAVAEYDSSVTYNTGELVYVRTGDPGAFVVFASLSMDNSSSPTAASTYSATTMYRKDEVVSYSGTNYFSLIEMNYGNTPANAPLPWDQFTTYSAAQTVTGSDGFIYSSVAGSNVGFNPVGDGGVHWTNTHAPAAWSSSPSQFTAATSWRPIYSDAQLPVFNYPISAGPLSSYQARNVYRLPAGHLRKAPQNPKNSGVGFLGSPAGNSANDWEFDGDYLVTSDPGPMVYRFVADVTDVRRMDSMFCEGLACRIALQVCEPLSQSGGKASTIAGYYQKFMSEARLINAIEIGAEDPDEDEYITCRV